jgi:hypothetical protein
MALVGIEGSDVSGFRLVIVGGKLSQEKLKGPVILLVGYIGREILFQDGIHPFCLTIGLKMVCCR